jgi:sugar fermentation stimulation protein A
MDYSFGLLEEAIFVNRDNRFRAVIQLGDKCFYAHVPNSGRMEELLVPGARVWIRKSDNPLRKTLYDLLLVEKEGVKVCINAHLANDIFAIWLQKGREFPFANFRKIYREKTIGKSRIDFLLEFSGYNYLVEIKSVNLVEDGVALFPDAPTERGAKHLEELIAFNNNNDQKAAVVFIIMRDDACSLLPHDRMDPLFGNTLRRAADNGVLILAYKCFVTEKGVNFAGEIPVIL